MSDKEFEIGKSGVHRRGHGSRGMFCVFAHTAQDLGDHSALEIDSSAYSYSELYRGALHVASSLRIVGVQPGARVVLGCDRSLETYVGYLGILAAGCSVVPVSREAPPLHRDLVVTQASASYSVNLGSVGFGLGDIVDVSLSREEIERVFHDFHAPNVACGVPSDLDVAYILFTSGSTGRPKGVPVTHRSVVHYLDYVIDRYRIGAESRLSQNFELTFDLSVFDLFAAWGGGGTVVVPSKADLAYPERYVSRGALTHWFSVPSVVSIAKNLGGLREPGAIKGLEWSLFCGEPFGWHQARTWARVAPNSVLENLYGPTELTLSCTQYRLPEPEEIIRNLDDGVVPIGVPYPGSEVLPRATSSDAEPTELLVRGVQRFSGYLDPNDNVGRFRCGDGSEPELAQISSGPINQEFWYRTGDLVSWSRGLLMHHGRSDSQFKIRGYRVEAGEIEAGLRGVDGVSDAVVVTAERGGVSHLVAYVVGVGVTSETSIRRTLKTRLPGHLVPDTVVLLDEFPHNTNGKVDRQELQRRARSADAARE